MGRKSKKARKKEEAKNLRNNIIATANEKIAEQEKEAGRKLTTEEKIEAFKIAEKEEKIKMMKLKIAKFFAKIGLAVLVGSAVVKGGLPEGNKPAVETTEEGKDTEKGNDKGNNNPGEEFRNDIHVDVDGTPSIEEEEKEEDNIIDEILDAYNANLSEEDKISKDNLGIIFSKNVGEGHIRKVITESGKITYIENPLISETLPEGEEWIAAADIQSVIKLVNNQNGDIVAAIGEIDYLKTEIEAQYAKFAGKEYTQNPATYVGILKGANVEDSYDDFLAYYEDRVQQKEADNNELDR